MKIRILDRILVAVAGLLVLAAGAGLAAQLYFQVDVAAYVTRVISKDTFGRRAVLTAIAAILILLGIYCILVLFRHRSRKDKFILQKTENGELAIAIKALDNMIEKCLEQHPEITAQNVRLENQRDGLLVRIRGAVAGGISIPLTVESLQKQIKQYVTACSGVEVKGVRVQIEASGEDAKDAPFAIEGPSHQSLLRSGEKAQENAAARKEEEQPAGYTAPAPAEPAEIPETVIPEPDEEDDRPIHQRLFSVKEEPCIVPAPPEAEPEAAPEEAAAEAAEGEAAETEEPETDRASAEAVTENAADSAEAAEGEEEEKKGNE